jgi:hypothetical protein
LDPALELLPLEEMLRELDSRGLEVLHSRRRRRPAVAAVVAVEEEDMLPRQAVVVVLEEVDPAVVPGPQLVPPALEVARCCGLDICLDGMSCHSCDSPVSHDMVGT